jgi:CheY-like chemotaxis protein
MSAAPRRHRHSAATTAARAAVSAPAAGTAPPTAGPTASAAPTAPAAPTASAAPTATILLVEDDNATRLATHRVLQDAGYKVLTARSGAEALLLAEAAGTQFDLLLTEAVMARMSGRELAGRLTAAQPDVRVLFMATPATPPSPLRPPPPSPAELLPKPFTPETLLTRIRHRLRPPP